VSAYGAKVDWIVVKGICDWGYKKNQADKDVCQKLAAKNAARVLKAALNVGSLYNEGDLDFGDRYPNSGLASSVSVSVPETSGISHHHLPEQGTLLDQLAVRSGLSDEAQMLLLTAAQADGRILHFRTLGGTHMQVGKKNLCEGGSQREAAKWEAALVALAEACLVKEVGYKGEVFEVTHQGYTIADQLRSEEKASE